MLMKTDDLGVPRFTNQNLIDMIYSGYAEKCHVVLCEPSDDVDKFNTALQEQGEPTLNIYIPLDTDKSTFDKVCQSEWLMPDTYKKINLKKWIEDRIQQLKLATPYDRAPEMGRALAEYYEFEKREMTDLLRYLIYLVDFMRENNIVWGVGRGSSVASYLLYLIGIHKVDSFKHNLDYKEFLR